MTFLLKIGITFANRKKNKKNTIQIYNRCKLVNNRCNLFTTDVRKFDRNYSKPYK